MNALIIEPYTPDTQTLIDGLHELTHCRIRHVDSVEEGLRTMGQTYCDVVLVTMTGTPLAAPQIVRTIRSHAVDLLLRPPDVILLFDNSLPIPEALRCRELGAMPLRREVPQAVYEEARLAFWKRATRRHETTILIDCRNGHHFLFVGSPAAPVRLGMQLTRLAVLLLSGSESYTVEFLADELGICRQSVKKYFFDLRRAFVQAQMQCAGPVLELFWMEKRPGGSVCGVRANVVWS